MGCFRLVIMGGGFIPTPQRSQALLHLRRWNFTCTCIWPIFSEYVKKDSILLPEIILDNRRQYLWNPLADFFVSYIFEIYSSRRKFWVLLGVCMTKYLFGAYLAWCLLRISSTVAVQSSIIRVFLYPFLETCDSHIKCGSVWVTTYWICSCTTMDNSNLCFPEH